MGWRQKKKKKKCCLSLRAWMHRVQRDRSSVATTIEHKRLPIFIGAHENVDGFVSVFPVFVKTPSRGVLRSSLAIDANRLHIRNAGACLGREITCTLLQSGALCFVQHEFRSTKRLKQKAHFNVCALERERGRALVCRSCRG